MTKDPSVKMQCNKSLNDLCKIQYRERRNFKSKNNLLKLLLAVMMLSLSVYGNSKNSISDKYVIETSSARSSDANVTLVWQDDLQTAFELAQKEQKTVMAMVEDVRCRWCIKMKEGALSDPEVQKNLQKYILLKIQRSDNEGMETLPGLRGPIPSFHFFTVKKKPIDNIEGYYETEDFLSYIKEIEEENL